MFMSEYTEQHPLTVKKLKEMLKRLPDNATIIVTDLDGNTCYNIDPLVHSFKEGYGKAECELDIIVPYIFKEEKENA